MLQPQASNIKLKNAGSNLLSVSNNNVMIQFCDVFTQF